MGDYAVEKGDSVISSSGLGSCVGVALHDTENEVSGFLHLMLPSSEEIDDDNEAKFADTGVEATLDEMGKMGAETGEI
ncbi:MAG: chemotaxis protein CheD, partial [Halobacteria archaeon]|nr:chemotaxis protein CheD [Halobacteria archaeon]